ncbi:MAG: SDR family NAD(P)-dependent oxidoreductase [Hyphomonadaceae bacterium]
MSEGIAGKLAIVTGAAAGIGHATALRLARAGADVAILDIDLGSGAKWGEKLTAPSVAAEVQALGRRAAAFEADLGDRAQATDAIAKAVAALGGVDILVNVAGGAITPMQTSFASITPDEDMRVLFAANYASAVNCSQAVLPMMRQRGGGAIVNVSSGAGMRGSPTGALTHCGAAKAALNIFTRALANEVGPDNIRVNAVLPGYTLSGRVASQTEARGFSLKATNPLGRFAEPDDIAKGIEFFCSDLAAFITGQCLAIDGGPSR